MRSREGWRVIKTVPNHENAAATGPERLDTGDFLSRFQPALPMLDTEGACDRRDRLGVVAGENAQVEPSSAQRIDHIDCVRSELLGNRNDRKAVAVPETNRRCLRGARCDHIAELWTSETTLDAVNARTDALSGLFYGIVERHAHRRLARECNRERMPARQGKPGRHPQQLLIKYGCVDNAELGQRQGAGLVKNDRVDL